ncbi:MAG: hypothetical protein ACI8W3_000117 [Myxococcota bacterium]|jgi:hypothetical protein
MRRILLYMLLLSASVSANAAENELKLGVTTATQYNTNVANVSQGKEDSFAFDIGPKIKFDSAGAKYEAGASYSTHFATYSQDGRRDNLSHHVGVHADYRPTSRLKFGINDVFSLQSDADRDFTDNSATAAVGGETTTNDGNGDKDTVRNVLNAKARYAFSPRLSANSSFGYSIVERQDLDLADTNQVSGRFNGEYTISPKDSIGIGVNLRHQTVEAANEIVVDGRNLGDNITDYYGFFAFINHRFTPLLSASVSGGPTWLLANRKNDGEKGSTSTDYFANASLIADINGGSASVSYQRSSSDFARTSTAFIQDAVSVNADWAMSRRLLFGVVGEWNQRKAILRFDNAAFVDKVKQWRGAATATYHLRPDLSTHLTFDYLRQKATGQSDEGASDRFRLVLRFDYNARAFRF